MARAAGFFMRDMIRAAEAAREEAEALALFMGITVEEAEEELAMVHDIEEVEE